LGKKRGRPAMEGQPTKDELVRLYVQEEKSIREAAETLGISKDMVSRALKTYGIMARPNASRSRLRSIPLNGLEAAIKNKGIRGTARELGLAEGTLRHHLKVRRGQ
jgi:predicted transcriptional regulator